MSRNPSPRPEGELNWLSKGKVIEQLKEILDIPKDEDAPDLKLLYLGEPFVYKVAPFYLLTFYPTALCMLREYKDQAIATNVAFMKTKLYAIELERVSKIHAHNCDRELKLPTCPRDV